MENWELPKNVSVKSRSLSKSMYYLAVVLSVINVGTLGAAKLAGISSSALLGVPSFSFVSTRLQNRTDGWMALGDLPEYSSPFLTLTRTFPSSQGSGPQ